MQKVSAKECVELLCRLVATPSVSGAEQGTEGLPLDVIPSLWERIPSDNLRKDAVEVLIKHKMLPDDLKDELFLIIGERRTIH